MYNYIASFFTNSTESDSSRATSETIESVSSRTEFTESWQNIDSALNDLGQKIAELDKSLYLPNTFEQIDQMNTAISEDVRCIIQKINCMRKMTVPDDQVADRNKKIVDASSALRRLTSCNLHNLQKYEIGKLKTKIAKISIINELYSSKSNGLYGLRYWFFIRIMPRLSKRIRFGSYHGVF
jgi:hypothetical protein